MGTFGSALAQGPALRPAGTDPAEDRWVDSVFNSMTDDERLGQLFMIAAYSNRNEVHYRQIEKLVRDYHLGGLIFFQGGPGRQVTLTNRYQRAAKVPLMIGQDFEWGLGMRLDSTMNFPKQMTLGAIQDDSLIYDMGTEIARQCQAIGVHVNFAPVVDVNSNPENPVIGYRSFGEQKEAVARKGIMYMKGMQDQGLMANAKHFPGHGDTDTDSHHALPTIFHDRARLNETELYPFREAFNAGMQSVMVAHIHLPAFDSRPNRATTLSKAVVTDLLKNELDFAGLVFTDALNMQGVAAYFKPGQVDVEALEAGNDVLLFSENVPVAMREIKKSMRKKNKGLNRDEVFARVKKILRAKYRLGLTGTQQLSNDNLHMRLHTPEAHALNQELYEGAMTVVRNKNEYLPIRMLDTTNFASLSLRLKGDKDAFQDMLGKYAPFAHYQLDRNADGPKEYTKLLERLRHYGTVVVGVHGMSNYASRNFGVKEEDLLFLEYLRKETNVVVVVFGNAYSLKHYSNFDWVLCAYEDNDYTRRIAPQVIFGGIGATGKLPVTASPTLRAGMGFITQPLGRLRYGQAERVGMNSKTLERIDGIMAAAIKGKATPGGQIVVAKDGMVVYEKAYGHHTYNQQKPVTQETIYDIASITKVAATLQTVMFLEGHEQLVMDGKAQDYLGDLKGTNKGPLKLRHILTHQAGLIAWIPHWHKTIDKAGWMKEFYRNMPEADFTMQVSMGLYARPALEDSLWRWTVESDLRRKRFWYKPYTYKYSDLGFYMMHKISESRLNQPMEAFLHDNFYTPMGLSTMGFKPLCHFPEERITPTENDVFFRNTLVHGMVHDQGAAMYGGVAGHAGLFSNANDLAKLMQMNLQDGYYGGTQYLAPGTVRRFAARQYKGNRRGLGWDKPARGRLNGPTSRYCSPSTFGHTGFTGTAAWVDPEFNLVYVFLSNRVYPEADNWKLVRQNIRTRVQDVMYESMWSYQTNYHN